MRGTKKFKGLVFYLVESEMTKTAAKAEAKRQRKNGYLARITKQPASVRAVKSLKYAVWTRKKKS